MEWREMVYCVRSGMEESGIAGRQGVGSGMGKAARGRLEHKSEVTGEWMGGIKEWTKQVERWIRVKEWTGARMGRWM